MHFDYDIYTLSINITLKAKTHYIYLYFKQAAYKVYCSLTVGWVDFELFIHFQQKN